MAGSNDILGIAVSGLLVSQRGLATAGHNISNVNTPGYSRQRVEVVTNQPQGNGNGFVGSGASVSTVRRILDGFIDQQIRINTASLGSLTEFHDLASQVDNILADPLGGLSPALQGFFGSLQDLAADPASIPARQVVLSEADTLAQRFHTLDQRFEDVRGSLDQRIRDVVAEMNVLASGVATLNEEIMRGLGAFGDQPPNDLMDQRDEMVRKLAELVSVSTVERADGAIDLSIGSGQGLVTGNVAATLSVQPSQFDPEEIEIGFTVGGATALITGIVNGGELGGALTFRDQVLGVGERALGQLAVGIARTVNDQHRLGMDLDGVAGGNFFTPLDTQAPAVFPAAFNTGAPPGAVTVDVADVSALTRSEYVLRRSGAVYTLTRQSDSTSVTLGTFPAGPEMVDGLTLDLASGAIADGDQFLIRPTGNAARDIGVVVGTTREIAVAAPVRGAASLANAGSVRIGDPVVNSPNGPVTLTFTSPTTFDAVDGATGATLATGLAYAPAGPPDTVSFNGFSVDIAGAPVAGDTFTVTNTVTAAGGGNTGTGTISTATVSPPDPNLTDPVTITFTTPTTFDVAGATTGAPTTGITYVSGAPVSFNGWTVTLTGTAAAGDVFTVGPTTNGVGDNRNGLALAALQTAGTLDGGNSSFGDVYGQLVVDVGTSTRQSEINRDAQESLLNQIRQSRDAVSGVNLDEEAADLLRFQQSFQASAQVVAAADAVFQALIGAVAR